MKKINAKIKRNSSVELLKIIGTFIIVLHHVAAHVPVEYNNKIGDIIIFIISGHMGNMGNCIFIVTSAFFLVESKNMKPDKAIYMILFETLSAFIILFIKVFAGKTILFKDIKFAISPFLTNQYWWFINAYIIYYLIHGYLNTCLNNILKYNHFLLCIFSIIFYTFLPVLIHNQLPTSTLTSFIVIHIFISYIKKYNLCERIANKKFVYVCGMLYFLLLFLAYELDVLTNTRFFSWRANVSTTSFYNIILLLFITSLTFYRNRINFYNEIINEISSLSLLMFIIHYAPQSIHLVRAYGWNYCDGLIDYYFDRLMYIGIGIFYYIFCILIAIIYKQMFDKVIHKISKMTTSMINGFCNIIFKYL